eukprot:scaffold394613_cov44-Prasinocladus_malaysianus.AAC.2
MAAARAAAQLSSALSAAGPSRPRVGSRPLCPALSAARRQCRLRLSLSASAAAEEKTTEMNTMAPLGNRLLIKPEAQSPVTSGGIILQPTDVQLDQDAEFGYVVALGEDVDLDVKPGDMVIFDSKSQVTEVPLGEESVYFVAQPSIHAILG